MIITSKDNQTVKFVQKLWNKKYRDEFCKFIVEGVRAVKDVLTYNENLVENVLVTPDKSEDFPNAVVVNEQVFASMCETKNGQGVLAVVNKPLPERVSSDYILFLDGIRDPGNLGTLIRTACASGYNDVVLYDCADEFSGKVVRSTMSAIIKINIVHGRPEMLKEFIGNGYQIIGADMTGKNLFKYERTDKVCVVIGGEANGISPEIRKFCVDFVSIPMLGNIESLNAGVSGALMMYNLKFTK